MRYGSWIDELPTGLGGTALDTGTSGYACLLARRGQDREVIVK